MNELVPQVESQCCDVAATASIKDILMNKRARLMKQLTEVEKALKACDENPKVFEVLELVTRATKGY